ncbi:MAG: nitrilase-related carbon-nitrogen hydrolase, partial [Bryobacteraceae bacterium]
MARIVRCSLIQARSESPADGSLESIKQEMIEKHVGYIVRAAGGGAQVVCLQELFYGPYFCAEQNTRWYDLTECVPDGPTTKLMQETARR